MILSYQSTTILNFINEIYDRFLNFD